MTDAVTLRPLTVDDAPAMATVLADRRLYEFTGGTPPTVDELRRRYEIQCRGASPDGRERWLNLVVLAGGEPAGYVQATVPVEGGPAEIAWVVGTPWQGRGIAGRAAGLLIEGLRREGVTEFVAHIHPDHAASARIATRLGLSPTDVVVDGETRWLTARP